MTDLIVNLILLVCGFVIGYNARRPKPSATMERLKVERVHVPQLVEKVVEKLRVEYIDRPVVVEKPTVQIEKVEVPYVVEKEKTIVEKVTDAADRAFGREPRAVPTPSGTVKLLLMDKDERTVKATEMVAATARRPTVIRHGMKFAASRQAENGDWIYRQLPRERS